MARAVETHTQPSLNKMKSAININNKQHATVAESINIKKNKSLLHFILCFTDKHQSMHIKTTEKRRSCYRSATRYLRPSFSSSAITQSVMYGVPKQCKI